MRIRKVIAKKALIVLSIAAVAMAAVFLARTRSNVVVEAMSGTDRTLASVSSIESETNWHRSYRFRREIQVSEKSSVTSKLKFDLRGVLQLVKQGKWIQASFTLDASKQNKKYTSVIPFYFTMNEQGEITEIRSTALNLPGRRDTEKTWDEDQQSILKDLSLLFAYRTPQDAAGEVQMKVTDGVGERKNELQKEKIRYLGKLGKLIQFAKSEHRIRKDLSLLAGVEVTHFNAAAATAAAKAMETESRYQLKLEKLEFLAGNQTTSVNVEELSILPIANVKTTQGSSAPTQPWKKLFPLLSSNHNKGHGERLNLLHEVVKTLRADRASLLSYVAWLESKRSQKLPTGGGFEFGIAVLSALGTADAQATLINFYESKSDYRILNALTTMQQPMTIETVGFLKAKASSENEAEAAPALFALGASLQRHDDDSVVDFIIRKYHLAQSLTAKLEVIDAMGNSGNEKFIPLLVSIVKDERSIEPLIQKAIYAFRLMKTAAARNVVAQLAHDQRYAQHRKTIAAAIDFMVMGSI